MKKNIKIELLKSVKKSLRDNELENSCGFVNKNKVFKSKKNYNRKDNKKIEIE